MLNRIFTFGALSGLIVAIPVFGLTVALHGHQPQHYAYLIGYINMLIALGVIFVAIKRRRDADLGGVIGFWPAFGIGLGISLIAGVFYVVAWEAAVAVTHMDFGTDYANLVIAKRRAAGVSGDALAKTIAEMERFKVQYANPFYRLPMVFAEIFPVGLLVSLVSAGLLRNPRRWPAKQG